MINFLCWLCPLVWWLACKICQCVWLFAKTKWSIDRYSNWVRSQRNDELDSSSSNAVKKQKKPPQVRDGSRPMQSPSPGHSLRHNWRWCVDITCFLPYMVYFNDSSMRWLLFVNHDEVFWGTLHLALTRAIMRSPITRPAPSGRFFYWRHHWWYGVDGQGGCSTPLAEKSCFHWSEPGESSHCLIEIVFAFEN